MKWWHELNRPEANPHDWYGELTNQSGHALLGIVASVAILAGWYLVAGEMPARWVVVLLVMLPYLAVEVYIQGWRPGDSWFDAFMVGCGVAAALCPWREIEPSGATVTIALHVPTLAGIVGLFCAALFLRVRRRYLASQVQQITRR